MLNSSPQTELILADLQKKLKTEEAILQSYFLGTTSNYLFTINEIGIRMYRLPDSEVLSPIILKFVHLFDGPEAINNDVSNFTKTAYKMFEVLQLNNGLNKKHLVLIPDGLLNFLPFESLLTKPTNGMSFSKMPFLAELVLESVATKNNFIEKAKNHDLIHLSTHAGSGDFIVPAHVQFYDDLLYLPELHSLDMKGKTIILSACETGIGKLQKGEGAISVARGFQYAGASSVLFSLWKVNDQSTALVMARFYESFKSTRSVFESNHMAKMAYLEDKTVPNAKKSPYYWNGFAYYGAIDSIETTNTILWWWGALILFLGLLIILLNKRKK